MLSDAQDLVTMLTALRLGVERAHGSAEIAVGVNSGFKVGHLSRWRPGAETQGGGGWLAVAG